MRNGVQTLSARMGLPPSEVAIWTAEAQRRQATENMGRWKSFSMRVAPLLFSLPDACDVGLIGSGGHAVYGLVADYAEALPVRAEAIGQELKGDVQQRLQMVRLKTLAKFSKSAELREHYRDTYLVAKAGYHLGKAATRESWNQTQDIHHTAKQPLPGEDAPREYVGYRRMKRGREMGRDLTAKEAKVNQLSAEKHRVKAYRVMGKMGLQGMNNNPTPTAEQAVAAATRLMTSDYEDQARIATRGRLVFLDKAANETGDPDYIRAGLTERLDLYVDYAAVCVEQARPSVGEMPDVTSYAGRQWQEAMGKAAARVEELQMVA